MANEQNLRPGEYVLSQEEAKRGGIASGKARRERRAMKESLDIILAMPVKGGKGVDVESIKNFEALGGKNITAQDRIVAAMVQRAAKGNVKAAEWCRDTVGERPADSANINMNLPVIISGEDLLEE